MIATELTATELIEAARPLWQTIADSALSGERGPHRCNVPGHELQLEAKNENGMKFALISAHGRDVEAWEEEALRLACDVPATAERVPMAGQDRVSRYRRGIVDRTPRHQLMFWWSLEEGAHG